MNEFIRNVTLTTDPLSLPTFTPPSGQRVFANLGDRIIYGTQLAQNGDVTVWDAGTQLPKRLPHAMIFPVNAPVETAIAA